MSETAPRWRAVLLGATGQLGFELARALAPTADVTVAGTPSSGAAFDVADRAAVDALVDAVRPDLVVNASAYTAVDAAEADPARAHAVNAEGPEHLARACARTGATLVHYSTDYVFDGRAGRAYREDDPTVPTGVYGRTKLAGEQAIAASGACHLILRTSWLFGHRGRNFPAAILARARAGGALRVVDDQSGCPTSARLLAEASAQLLAQARAAGASGYRDWFAERQGIYHAAGAGSCTWYELAREIIEHAVPAVAPVDIEPVSTAEYGAAAPRPAHSVLDCTRLRETFGLELPAWEVHIRQVLEERPEAILAGVAQ